MKTCPTFQETKHEDYGTLCSHHTKCLPEKFPKSEKVLRIFLNVSSFMLSFQQSLYTNILVAVSSKAILLKTGTPRQRIPHFPPQNLQIPSIFPQHLSSIPGVSSNKWATKKNNFLLSIFSRTSIMTNKYNQHKQLKCHGKLNQQ